MHRDESSTGSILPDRSPIASALAERAAHSDYLPEPDGDAASALFDEPDAALTCIDGYWVNEPYAYVSIGFHHDTDEHRYRVVEPALTTDERYVRDDLARMVRHHLDVDLNPDETTTETFLARIATLEPAGTLAATTAGQSQFVTDVDVVAYRRLLYHAAIIQAFGNGLVLGVVVDDLLAGAKYAAGFLALTGIVFVALGVLH